MSADYDEMKTKKTKYQHQYEKYNKMSSRLQKEKTELEERQQELTQEIQRLELIAQNTEDLDVEFPGDYDEDLNELDGTMQEDSYGDEDADQVPTGTPEQETN